MNCLRFRVLNGQMRDGLCELRRRTIRRGEGEMTARLGLYRAEDIRRSAALVFIVASRSPSWCGGRGGADISMECNRLLIQTHRRFLEIIGPFIGLQNILHLGDVLVIEFGHTPHFFPATASGRGGGAEPGWFLVPPVAPVSA